MCPSLVLTERNIPSFIVYVHMPTDCNCVAVSWQRVRPTCSGTWLLHVLSLGAAQAGCSGRVAQLAALACTDCWAGGECC